MRTLNATIYEAQARVWLSKAQLDLGQRDASKANALKALELATVLKQKASLGFAKRMLAVVETGELCNYADSKENAEHLHRIENLFTESLSHFGELKMEHEAARTRLEMASFYKKLGNTKAYGEQLALARGVLEKLGAPGDLRKIRQAEST